MPAAENLQGKDFNIEEGVSCGACHGPSTKWNPPHKAKGWTDKERKAAGTHDALLKKWGLYDTKSPLARAYMCTSCHLAIDADMVAAVDSGDNAEALGIYRELIPLVEVMMTRAQGAMTAKAAMELLGVLDNRRMRLPLVECDDRLVAEPRDVMQQLGYLDRVDGDHA